MPDSTNFQSLSYQAKARYIEKLKLSCGQVLPDPYQLESALWSDDPKTWPDVEFGDIYTNLVDTPGQFTKTSMKAYKSLEAYK